jgi:hypothetical protein
VLTCEPDEYGLKFCDDDIHNKLQTINVELLFANANFNPKDLKSAVTYYVDTRLYQQIVPNTQKMFNINLQRQKALSTDDIFGFQTIE